MSARYRSDPEMGEYQKPSGCANFLHYTWKTITCIISHVALISMVVSYCALGAVTFAKLEVEHERVVKRNISQIRNNVTENLWKLTVDLPALREVNFTEGAEKFLREFEAQLVRAMTKDGWDGEEDERIVQWTTTGALFYSIIVITTIGYGHISPKTTWGKVVTIFYAILGIPLMLLCLSNIGDIMATSFRFLYWRVCCYMCTKKPKKRRAKSFRNVSKASEGRLTRSRTASFRRSMRTSTKSADSGFGLSEIGPCSHSDTDLRYHDHPQDRFKRGCSLPRMRPSQAPRYADPTPQNATQRSQRFQRLQKSVPRQPVNSHGGSLDRRKYPKGMLIELDPVLMSRTPVLCNKYVVGNDETLSDIAPGITMRDMEGQGKTPPLSRRAKSMPRNQHYLEPPRFPSPVPSSRDSDIETSPKTRPRRKKSPPHMSPSPKMMTPLGYGHRSKYLDDPDSDSEYYYEDDDEYYEITRMRTKPVPIWLCVFLVVSYIIAGAFLFQSWEGWKFLDAAYFCFITLTTIGFGDFVPAKGQKQNNETLARLSPMEWNDHTDFKATVSIALCSLYLLFGIALLAMSFNLVQEEVISKVKSVAKTLGIIKKDEDDSEEED